MQIGQSQAGSMGRSRPSLLHRLLDRPAVALSSWLLASRLIDVARVLDQLVDSLVAAIPASLGDGALELAIVEGALAISLADGSFGQEERELYASTLARLQLSAQQRQAISLQGSRDLRRIATSLSALQDPSHRLEIGRCGVSACLRQPTAKRTGTRWARFEPSCKPSHTTSSRESCQPHTAGFSATKPGGSANAVPWGNGSPAGNSPTAGVRGRQGANCLVRAVSAAGVPCQSG